MSSDLKKVNRELLEDFIRAYQSQPCLWRIKSQEYHDKAKKDAAYVILLNKYRLVDNTADKDAVIKKINSFRMNYRREKKKVEASRHSGVGTDEIYEPSLWYYHLFEFLEDQETPRSSSSNFNEREGRTFSGLIQSFLSSNKELNNTYLPLYETEAGRKVYDETLQSVKNNFPQYVREMEGTADGAGVPFHKLFLLHLDDIVSNVVEGPSKSQYCNGCSSICCNQPGEEILGHTEDALNLVLNHFYFVSAHVISETPQGRWGVKEERFTSLCYAGYLPGFTMSYNHHGLVFSVNVISAKKLVSGKTPRYFLTRAMLGAENLVQVQQILRDKGCGSAEGFSINMTFLRQEGNRLFHNAEVSPAADGAMESGLSILTASPGEFFVHCNKYLRLQTPEIGGCIMESSNHRHATMSKMPVPLNRKDIINMLGDQSDPEYMVFRDNKRGEYVKTIAVGIFDCIAKTWSIYSDNPKTNEPIVVLPLVLKSENKKSQTL